MWAFVVILALAAALLQKYSLRHSLDNVCYDCTVSRVAVDPDESFEIVTTVQNGGRLPVFFLRAQERLPDEIDLKGEGLQIQRDRDVCRLVWSCYLMPRQKLERRVCASLPERGRYFLRGGTLSGGDFLGLQENTVSVQLMREIVVLPRSAPRPDMDQMLGGFLGDQSVNRFIMEDPVLTLGFREYTGREPQKAISWPVSARTGRLMVKKYDYTIEQTATVLLNVECDDQGRAPDPDRIEKCFSLARAVCEALEEKGVQYGFLTNATAAGAMGLWSSVADGLGAGHLYTILEGLGRATYSRTEPFSVTLERATRRASQGRAHIVVSPREKHFYRYGLSRLRELSGQDVLVLTPDSGEGVEA